MAENQVNPGAYSDVDALLNEIERIQSKLEDFQGSLAESHRLSTLGTIAAVIAHEFNNILTPVISYCQMAEQAPEDIDLLRKAVNKSLYGAEKASQISASLLGFASHHANQLDHCDLKEVVDEVLNCMAREPKKDGIQLTLEFDGNSEIAIEPIALQQVLFNLILNARQAMKNHGGSISLRSTVHQSTIPIELSDSGPGIPEEILPTIFDPFVTHRDDDEEKGTGLGLSICHQLIEKAGGQIQVDSIVGEGTTFTIQLPSYEPNQTSAA